MVLLSAITVAANSERLMCGGFSLSEPVHLGNFEFIADYFGGLSLSPREATQALPSWAQLTAGHQPCSGP
jgi:hypothetical protein